MKITSSIFLALFIALLSFSGFSQNTGFIGKKNFITIGGGGGIRLLPLLSLNKDDNRTYYTYDEEQDKFEDKTNLLKWNLNASYKRLIKRNVAVGVMFDYTKFQISENYSPNNLIVNVSGYYTNNYLLKTSPNFHVLKIKPTITLSPSNSLLPMGINHTLGIGPTLYVMNTSSKHYYQSLEENNSIPGMTYLEKVTKEINPAPEEFSNNYWGIEFMYSTTINYPISKFMMIEFGYDLRIGTAFPNTKRDQNAKLFKSETVDEINSRYYYNYNYQEALQHESLTSILSFRLGLVFAL